MEKGGQKLTLLWLSRKRKHFRFYCILIKHMRGVRGPTAMQQAWNTDKVNYLLISPAPARINNITNINGMWVHWVLFLIFKFSWLVCTPYSVWRMMDGSDGVTNRPLDPHSLLVYRGWKFDFLFWFLATIILAETWKGSGFYNVNGSMNEESARDFRPMNSKFPEETKVQLTNDVIWGEVGLVSLYRNKIIPGSTFVHWLHHQRWIHYYE